IATACPVASANLFFLAPSNGTKAHENGSGALFGRNLGHLTRVVGAQRPPVAGQSHLANVEAAYGALNRSLVRVEHIAQHRCTARAPSRDEHLPALVDNRYGNIE